jgi:hypothetical protein
VFRLTQECKYYIWLNFRTLAIPTSVQDVEKQELSLLIGIKAIVTLEDSLAISNKAKHAT